jgi:hypothetical protein
MLPAPTFRGFYASAASVWAACEPVNRKICVGHFTKAGAGGIDRDGHDFGQLIAAPVMGLDTSPPQVVNVGHAGFRQMAYSGRRRNNRGQRTAQVAFSFRSGSQVV